MKIAVTGKGGVGKTTVAAALSLLLARRGQRVLCLDADPDANLASALGVSQAEQERIIPISKRLELIEERTGAKTGTFGGVFKLNPDVSDVAEKFSSPVGGLGDNLSLLVLGAIQNGGGGCACAESTFVRSLVADLVLYKNETLIMDMEAGVEHLGRATAGGVDVMLVVVEPGKRSIDCARLVFRMAGEIGIKRVAVIANKVASEAEEAYIRSELPGREILAVLPYDNALRLGDRDGVSALEALNADTVATLNQLLDTL